MTFPHIILRDMSVDFPIYSMNSKSFRHAFFLNHVKSVKKVFVEGRVGGALSENDRGQTVVRALSNIDLEISAGDRIGLVGHNGSGKTTLLRVLSGIFEPTNGSIEILGKTMSLFNITEGMEPDATGLELIKVRGYLLGLTPTEIRKVTNDVIDFCELGDFLQLPTRTYSAGMFIRLAFGITTALTSDILLMDEIIGAGDAAFLERAEARLERFVRRAGIVVIASHSAGIIQKWCNKALLLEHGRVIHFGETTDVLKLYEERISHTC